MHLYYRNFSFRNVTIIKSSAVSHNHDDLTSIKWIGYKRENLLKDLNIYTIAQVAELTEEKLKEILNSKGKLSIPDKRIKELKASAQELSKKGKK